MTAVAETLVIDRPGIYDGIPDEAYHADPVPGGSLSSTGARRILDSPARFRYEQDHPRESAAFDLGKAAHLLVLGEGAQITVIDAEDWRTKAAREARDTVRAAGKAPLLTKEMEQVKEMAAAIRAHPLAGPLFEPGTGLPEQSLFWEDPATGVMCRARLDWLRQPRIVADYKSCDRADRASFARSVANFGYHQQAAFYEAGVRALGVMYDPAFLFAAQEKTPPYLVAVYGLDDLAMEAGRARNRQAIERYRDCKEAGIWPGYGDDIEYISLPPWALRTEEHV